MIALPVLALMLMLAALVAGWLLVIWAIIKRPILSASAVGSWAPSRAAPARPQDPIGAVRAGDRQGAGQPRCGTVREDVQRAAPEPAHSFGAHGCRVIEDRRGRVWPLFAICDSPTEPLTGARNARSCRPPRESRSAMGGP